MHDLVSIRLIKIIVLCLLEGTIEWHVKNSESTCIVNEVNKSGTSHGAA